METKINVALNLLFGLLDRAQAIGDLINTSRAAGRDISDEELDALVNQDDIAREDLVRAIRDARR